MAGALDRDFRWMRAVMPVRRGRGSWRSRWSPLALVYPLARNGGPGQAAVLREIGGVAAMAAATALAARSDQRNPASAAWGWLAHASFFDLVR